MCWRSPHVCPTTDCQRRRAGADSTPPSAACCSCSSRAWHGAARIVEGRRARRWRSPLRASTVRWPPAPARSASPATLRSPARTRGWSGRWRARRAGTAGRATARGGVACPAGAQRADVGAAAHHHAGRAERGGDVRHAGVVAHHAAPRIRSARRASTAWCGRSGRGRARACAPRRRATSRASPALPVSTTARPAAASASATAAKRSAGQRRDGSCAPGCTHAKRLPRVRRASASSSAVAVVRRRAGSRAACPGAAGPARRSASAGARSRGRCSRPAATAATRASARRPGARSRRCWRAPKAATSGLTMPPLPCSCTAQSRRSACARPSKRGSAAALRRRARAGRGSPGTATKSSTERRRAASAAAHGRPIRRSRRRARRGAARAAPAWRTACRPASRRGTPAMRCGVLDQFRHAVDP